MPRKRKRSRLPPSPNGVRPGVATPLTIRQLWETSEIGRGRQAAALRTSTATVLRHEDERGFRRAHPGGGNYRGSRYEAGPCVECEVPWPVEEISARWLCPVCEEASPAVDPLLERER